MRQDAALRRLLLLGLALHIAAPPSAHAHVLDQYLQASRIELSQDRVAIELDLTPGIEIAPWVFLHINSDRDGVISASEARVYANEVLQDLQIAVDDHRVPLTLTDYSYPAFDAMRAGTGTIRVRVTSPVRVDAPGRHTIFYRNRHQPERSAYLVNALVPTTPAITIDSQRRDAQQTEIRIEFAVSPRNEPVQSTRTLVVLGWAAGLGCFGFFGYRLRRLHRSWLALLLAMMAFPSTAGAQRQTAVEAERAGWAAVRAGQAQEASLAFRDALRLEPRNVTAMVGAGLASYLLGRLEEARQHLSGALQIDPSLTEASRLFGQVLYRQGDLDGAIQVYEQAVARAPGDAMMTAKLDAWRREADLHGRFSQRLGDHFTVMFEGPAEEEIAAKTVELLEAAYWRIGTAIGAYPMEPVTVVLYTQEQFRDITRSPSWAAGSFDGRIRVPIRGALRNPRELDRILCHEFTHALVRGLASRGVPQWLNEGLALMFEPAAKPDGDSSPSSNSETAAAPSIPLSRLETSFDGLSGDQARLAYSESAAAVRALVDQAGMPAILSLLQNLGDGMTFDAAFERATQITYAEFQRSRVAARLDGRDHPARPQSLTAIFGVFDACQRAIIRYAHDWRASRRARLDPDRTGPLGSRLRGNTAGADDGGMQ
jgi:tetratricopeptide (TPR) repeat protein